MKERVVIVEPFDFIDFRQVDIYKSFGCHGKAEIVGMISIDNAEKYLSSNFNNVQIKVSTTNEFENIFSGMIEDIWVDFEGEIALLHLKLITHSFLMDISKPVRTFQDTSMTYRKVADIVTEDSGLGVILSPNHSDKTIGKMLTQYEETDWEFANRIASRLGTFVVTDHLLDSPVIAIGMVGAKKNTNIVFEKYSLLKDNAEYLKNKEHGVNANYTYYKTQSRESYELCSRSTFHGQELLISRVESHLVGDELMHYYTLKPQNGIVQYQYFNKQIIGMSLTGNVLEVEKDLVKVAIQNDVTQTEHKWFSYATVYSSADNTGWYFMPEVDDEVKLHFPSEVEHDSYVMSSVHLDDRSDADTKSIRTKWRKEVVFTPTSIYISNGTGDNILLDDDSGIHINSAKQIKVTADDKITFDAVGKVEITGGKGVVIKQTGNQIIVDENIDISAGHVRIR